MTKKLSKFDLKVLTIGHLIFHSMDYGFDFLLYPYVIFLYGPLYGGIGMTILSAIYCLSMAWVYDFLEKDWLGIETVKQLVEEFFKEEEEMARHSLVRIGKRILRITFHKNKAGQFIFLSIHFDALITTIYMRPGYHLYNGFSKKDWKIFWGSTIVSNVWWIGVSFTAVSVLRETIAKFF